MMPEKETFNQKDIEDAKTVAEIFHLKTQVCDLTEVVEAFYQSHPNL